MREPTLKQVKKYMKENRTDFYNAREALREHAYGHELRKQGIFKDSHQSWGDYWKSR